MYGEINRIHYPKVNIKEILDHIDCQVKNTLHNFTLSQIQDARFLKLTCSEIIVLCEMYL